jgi:hypothetical protein
VSRKGISNIQIANFRYERRCTVFTNMIIWKGSWWRDGCGDFP